MTTVFDLIQEGDPERLAAHVEADPASVSVRNADGMSPVMLAAYMQRADLLDILLEADPPIDFFEAAAIGDDSIVRDILLEDSEIANRESFDGFTALHLASFFGHPDVSAVLIGAGANPDAVTPNEARLRPLHSAVAGQHFEIVEQLLDAGAEPNAEQNGGWTPLMAAAQHGDLSTVWLLVQKGAEINKAREDGTTAETLARTEGHDEVADWLAKQGSSAS